MRATVAIVWMSIGVCGAAVGQPCEPYATAEFRSAGGGFFEAGVSYTDGYGPRLLLGGWRVGPPDPGVFAWDGSAMTKFGGDLRFVRALAVHEDGPIATIYAAGTFDLSETNGPRHAARWDGSTWQPVGDGPGGPVNVLIINGPSLIAGGSFATVDAGKHGVSMWDGTQWLPLGLRAEVVALAFIDIGDGPELFAGTAEAIDGNSLWTAGAPWQPIGDIDGAVRAIVAWPDDDAPRVAVGGEFTSAGGIAVQNVATWKPETNEWTPLGNTLGAVADLALWDDGATTGSVLYAGISSDESVGLAYWDGKEWAFVPGQANHPKRLVIHDDGSGFGSELMVIGNGVLGRVPQDTTPRWQVLSSGVTGNCSGSYVPSVGAIGIANDRIHVGGCFAQAGRENANGLAALDGSGWASPLVPLEGIHRYAALSEYDDGSGPALYAGGRLLGTTCTGFLARFDDRSSGIVGCGSGRAFALAAYDDGLGDRAALYVAGDLEMIDGVPLANMARWDGASWSAPGAFSGDDGRVFALQVFDDGSGPALYVGGRFETVNGLPLSFIARWNGETWTSVGNGVDGPVFSMAVYDDGSGPALYVTGWLTESIARWDGTTWSSVGEGPGAAAGRMAVFDDGRGSALYVATSGPDDSVELSRWDGDAWTTVDVEGLEHASSIYAMLGVGTSADPGGASLLLGGRGLGSGIDVFLRIRGCSLRALGDVNGDGAIDMLDIDAMFAAWGDCPAPCDADVYADGIVDSLDLLLLLANWTG